jgi:EAL domain-containing protein (putative c-di-GMP-specific phosphodiesterase class I)
LEIGLRSAAGNGELFLLYQPEVDVPSGRAIGVEALTRWMHPRLGELGPESFIGLAEQSDTIQLLWAWLIEEAFRDFGAWMREVPSLGTVLRLNISPVQLARPGIAEQFAVALDRHGLRGEQVCVELTENVDVPDPETLALALAELRKLGVGSAIDDLESGFSTLSRLRALDVDLVKLDRSLVHGIDSDPRARTIVRSLIGLAAELGVGVIAEGVESRAEADTLVALGCPSAQGHYFARPMASADALAYLRAHDR